MKNWLREIRLNRYARALFPETALCDEGIAKERFREALAVAREAYQGMYGAGGPRDFVHPAWEENIQEVERYFLTDFDMAFLNHLRINGTMVFTDRKAHAAERPVVEAWRSLDLLQKYAGTGLNTPFLAGKLAVANATNSLHHLHHLARFERFRGTPVETIQTVVEFGGGYGNMARIFWNFGNLARYVIIDLPLFCCIQYVFLATVMGPGTVQLMGDPSVPTDERTIRLLPITSLPNTQPEGDLFVSTWALSECPINAYAYVREREWFGARELLIGFNDAWKPWNTEQVLAELRGIFERVALEPLPFMPGNRYLFARKRITPTAGQ